FLRIEKDAVIDVADESILGPTVPQSGHDIVEFARAAITLAMLHVLVQPEIKPRIGVGCRHDIPTGASVAQMIERSKPPRDVIGRMECGGAGGNEADPFGDLR